MDLPMIRDSAFLTIDSGGTYLKSAVLNGEGELLEGSYVSMKAISAGSKEEILLAFKEIITKGIKYISNVGKRLEGIGVAFPGPFDCINGIPLLKHKFSNIYGVNMREFFRDIPGVLPEIPIRFIPDAHAVLSGELWKGNAVGYPDTAIVTLGTGLGFAFSKNGIVQSNSIGGPLVTIYRIPYKESVLEDYIGRSGILKYYSEKSDKSVEEIDVSDIGKWANEGDRNSIDTFRDVGSILAEGLHDILNDRGIQCLLLGGQISRSFHHMEETLKKGLKDLQHLQKISVVKDIGNAAFIGAFRAI
jgi:predicted NBD/HSP70 family sugar kinase